MEDKSVAVKPAVTVNPQAYNLSELDQITLRIYGRNLLFFGLAPNIDIAKVFEQLREGLSHVLKELPVFAGEIVTDPATKRMRFEQSREPSMILHYRDLRKSWSCGSFAELQSSNFPMSVIAPVAQTLISQPGIPTTERVPVSDAVVSFIPGGVILGLSWHHGFTGVEGRSIFLERWSKHTAAAGTSGNPVEALRMSYNASDRSLLCYPALDTVEFPNWLRLKSGKQDKKKDQAPVATPPKLVGAIWRISAVNLESLKSAASSDSLKASANDALCALLWRSITLARKKTQPLSTSMLAIPIDIRRRVDNLLPLDYLGNAASFASPIASEAHICNNGSGTLVELAQLIRNAIHSVDKASVEKLLGSIAAVPDTTQIHWDIDLQGSAVMCTNWTRTTLLDHSWGPDLGTCAALRLPGVPVPGTCVLMPRPVHGAIEIYTGLTEAQNKVLREDSELNKYLNYICE